MFFFKKGLILVALVCFVQTAKADWTIRDSNSLAWFHDVFFVSENKGWIAGSDGNLLATTDGGKNWKKAKIPARDNVRRVYFADENNGWLLCERNIYGLGALAPSYLLKTSDGGAQWEKIEFSGSRRERIVGIFFNRKGAGFAVGEGGAYFALQKDRKSWKKNAAPIRYLMLDGAFADDERGAMVGAGGTILLTEDAGFSWNKSGSFNDSTAKLNAVFFVNPKTGWTVGAEGKIFQTFDGGNFWREQNSLTKKDLTDVFFNNTAEGWAVGDEGLILHTTTAGNVWTIVEPLTTHRLEKMFFVGKKGWAVGFGGTILSYN